MKGSLDEWRQRYAEMDRRDPRSIHEIFDADDFGVALVRSPQGCLNHRVKFVIQTVSTYNYALRTTYVCECGIWVYGSKAIVLDPADSDWICHRCATVAEARGVDTFRLIPDTGCAATGGQRFRPRVKTVDNRSQVD